MKISEVLNCSFSAWYPKFKDHTIKSQIIYLPEEFVDYLLADQVVLPEGNTAGCSNGADEDDSDNENLIDWSTEDILTPVAEPPSFPEFEQKLKAGIRRLGGRVFPKLNWSAPRDASWISFDKTLKCTCPSDVYLLLKSSDFITHDLTQSFDHCSDDKNMINDTAVKYELVLRKWEELNPAYEFRCFVKDNRVIGICQRHNDMYYSYMNDARAEIKSDICSFFYHVIKDNFPDKNFCFDVYRRSQGKLLLLDFNPFGRVTDGLLFTWEELESEEELLVTESGSANLPVFRYIESHSGVLPSPYSQYALPRDVIDIASGEDPTKIFQLLQEKMREQNNETDSDTDNETYELTT